MEIASIRDFVGSQCQQNENIFGSSFFDQHLAVVAEYAGILAKDLGADGEIVELAAYLHDLSAVRDASTIPNHANLSASLARQLLTERACPPSLVDGVVSSIAAHSNPIPIGRRPPEEVCVSNADAMAQIARPLYWSYVVFGIRKQVFEAGRQWLLQLYEIKWNALIQPGRELVADKYRGAMTLLMSSS